MEAAVPLQQQQADRHAAADLVQEVDDDRHQAARGYLIPDLPDEVAYRCLSRVSIQSHAKLHFVSRKWRDFVSSREFYEQRKQEGATKHCLCMLQALPAAAAAGSSSSPPPQHPIYGISMMVYDDEEESRRRPELQQQQQQRQQQIKQKEVWEWLPPIPELAHYGLPLFCRLACARGKLLVLGGWHPRTWQTLRTVYIFDFATRKWRRGVDMLSTRSSFACQALPAVATVATVSSSKSSSSSSSYVLVAGGHDNGKNALATAEIYDVERDRWRALPNMNDCHDECTAAVIDGEFFVVGGYNSTSSASLDCRFLASSEILKAKANKWIWTDLSLSSTTTTTTTTTRRIHTSARRRCPAAGSRLTTSRISSSPLSTATSMNNNCDAAVTTVSVKPRTNLHCSSSSNYYVPLFGFHERELVCYSRENDEWQVLDVLPNCKPQGDDDDDGNNDDDDYDEEESMQQRPSMIATPVCITALGADKLFVAGPQKKDSNSFACLIYNMQSRSRASESRSLLQLPGSSCCSKELKRELLQPVSTADPGAHELLHHHQQQQEHDLNQNQQLRNLIQNLDSDQQQVHQKQQDLNQNHQLRNQNQNSGSDHQQVHQQQEEDLNQNQQLRNMNQNSGSDQQQVHQQQQDLNQNQQQEDLNQNQELRNLNQNSDFDQQQVHQQQHKQDLMQHSCESQTTVAGNFDDDDDDLVSRFRGKWEILNPGKKFQGVILTSCVVEI